MEGRGDQQDWQTKQKLTDCNRHLLENELYCDVEFRVGETGTLIKAHKLMLAKRSPVFERMFYGSMPETRTPIEISDIEPEAFKALLRYCYLEDLDVNRDVALATLYAAKKYILPSLEEECREILMDGLAPTNILEVYASSIMTPDEELHAVCRDYFWDSVTEIESILKSLHFLNIPNKVLLDMLQLNDTDDRTQPDEDRIIVSQIELFKACNAWAEA